MMAAASSPRRVNVAGLELIERHEGLRLEAYRCPAGRWSIGYGHTGQVRPGDRVTPEEAHALLARDLAHAERAVARLVRVPLTDNQFAALVSFCFNAGEGALARSTLLRNLNRGWLSQVPAQLMRWTHAGEREIPGLVRRRRDEAELWKTV